MSLHSDLQSILQENLSYLKRKELISLIEENLSKQFSKKVAVAAYIANTLNPGVSAATSMNLTHIAHVDDLIRTASSNDVEAVALILETFGGEATFPLEVIQRARKYSKNFYVVVVNVAKSAGTLLSLISDKIISLETASFGPIDPQIVISTQQGPQTVSGRQIKELIEITIPNIVKDRAPAERAAILATQNYALYQQALDGLKLVKEVIDAQLGPRLGSEQVDEIKSSLVDIPLSHGINVTCDDLSKLGFDVMIVRAKTELGQSLLEYHRRALKNLLTEAQGGQGLVLFENKKASFQIVAQVMPQLLVQRPPQPPPTTAPQKPSQLPPSSGSGQQAPTGEPPTSSLV
jgi:ATP-dependent protease ClpP protease subunit